MRGRPVAPDENFARELAEMAEERKEDYSLPEHIRLRIARVTKFLEHISREDDLEISESIKRGGPYQERLSDAINVQLKKEMGATGRPLRC